MITYVLRFGDSREILATVEPDKAWETMWRIYWPDGRRSDVTNLSRAKDAAEVLSLRDKPCHETKLLRWSKLKYRGEPLGGAVHSLKWPEGIGGAKNET